MIISGDEYQCILKANEIIAGQSILSKSKIIFSRSIKDNLETNNNDIFICCGYIHKNSDYFFNYIKLGQEHILYEYGLTNYEEIPLNEFKDLQTGYAVVAYDLLEYQYNRNIERRELPNVFEFSDYYIEKDFKHIYEKYSFLLKGDEESYFWVAIDQVDTCLRILAGEPKIHSFKVKKLKQTAKELGFEELFRLKNLLVRLIVSRRNNENYYRTLRILEELAQKQ